jgi:hypothetical protein
MLTRQAILVVVLVAIVGLAYLTLKAVADGGFDVLTVLSLLVLALFGFGIVGALMHPPEE